MPDPGRGPVLTRLALLGGIFPRSVTSAVRASRRSDDDELPACPLGPRQVGEAVLDEFFLAASAVVRSVPDESVVAAAVQRSQEAADELAGLGVSGANVAPRPLEVLRSIPRRLGATQFERLDYASTPELPPSLAAVGLGRQEVASVRTMRHIGGPGPWVVWIHGAGQGRSDDLISLRARHMHEVLGLNAAFPVLPLHGLRRRRREVFPSFDPLVNVAVTLRGVSEVRAVVDWIARQEATSIAVVGLSLGGPIAALVAELEPAVDSVGVVIPMLDLHGTLAHHLDRGGEHGKRLATLLRSEPVRRVSSVIDPMILEPYPPTSRRVVLAASNDRLTSMRAAQRLHERWQGEVAWHAGGHIGHLMSSGARSVVDDFLLSDNEVRSPEVP